MPLKLYVVYSIWCELNLLYFCIHTGFGSMHSIAYFLGGLKLIKFWNCDDMTET